MTEQIRIEAISAEGGIEPVSVSPSSRPPWRLIVDGLGMRDETFEADDLFEALLALRRRLEGLGWRLLCAGGRRDVFPSGMARSMGSARKAYVTEIGQPARELVDIFESARPDEVGTVDEQRDFRQRWIMSLREKMR